MKKLISIALLFLVLVSIAIPALAEKNDGSAVTEIAVTGDYVENVETRTIISVDISWEAMDFTYASDVTQQWLPESHSYASSSSGSWAEESKRITLVNHSNAAVNADLSFVPAADVTGAFSTEKLGLPSAVDTESDQAPTAVTSFGITGGTITQDTNLGTIRISISSDSAAVDPSDDEAASGSDDTVTENAAVCRYKPDVTAQENVVPMEKTGDKIYTAAIENTNGIDKLLMIFEIDGVYYGIKGGVLSVIPGPNYYDSISISSGASATITIDIGSMTYSIQ